MISYFRKTIWIILWRRIIKSFDNTKFFKKSFLLSVLD